MPRLWGVSIDTSDDLRARLNRLHSGARRWRWEPEDLGAFAAGALWTYLTMPLLLARAEGVERLRDAGGRRRLRLVLPASVAGHGPVHTLHLGPDGRIARHDYTATAFGTWARGAQQIATYEVFDGVPVGTTRRVTPRLGRRLPGPTLVWIQLDSMRLL